MNEPPNCITEIMLKFIWCAKLTYNFVPLLLFFSVYLYQVQQTFQLWFMLMNQSCSGLWDQFLTQINSLSWSDSIQLRDFINKHHNGSFYSAQLLIGYCIFLLLFGSFSQIKPTRMMPCSLSVSISSVWLIWILLSRAQCTELSIFLPQIVTIKLETLNQ